MVDKPAKKASKVSDKSKSIKKERTPATKLSRRFNKLKVKPEHLKSRGIIYIGHLPKGFSEDELKKFFTQFGKITKIRVARSKKTGRPKGYAFLEFTDKDVAEIAVQTMNGYMMFHRQIECHMVEAAHKDTFKHGNREWKFVPTQVMFRNKKNQEKTPEQKAARVEGLLGKEKEKRIRLKELGIEYDFPGYQAIVDKAPVGKKTKKVEAKVEAKVESKKENKREAKAESKKEVKVESKKESKKDSKKDSKKESKSKRNESVETSEEKPRRSSRKETPEVIEKPKKSSRKESEEKVEKVEKTRKSSRNSVEEPKEEPKKAKKSDRKSKSKK